MSRTPSPIDFKKQQCGFVAATKRPRCGSCAHVKELDNMWSCPKNHLFVTVYAVCDDWKSPAEALNPVPERPKTGKGVDGAVANLKSSEAASSGWIK